MVRLLLKLFKFGDSVVEMHSIFREHFNISRHGEVPSRNTVQLWVENFRTRASALKRNRQAVCVQCDRHRTLRL
jgi:hypothetical protein